MRATALFAALMIVGGVVSVGAAPAAQASPLAPQWLVNFVRGQARGQAAGIMESLGFHCANTPFVCWHDTDYDPPRWFRYGVVNTGNGPGGYLRARGWPGTTADVPVIRTFPESWKLVIFCQTLGPWVYGRWGWTNVWDYVGHYGDAPMFVSDGYVVTGSNGFVSGDCGATNFGGNP